MTKILFLGDVFAKTGRQLVRDRLPGLMSELKIDLALANAENAAGGRGITLAMAWELFDYGLKALSGGNHTFRQRKDGQTPHDDPRVIRPANFPSPCPGRGFTILTVNGVKVGFANLMGRVFMSPILDCPFRAADQVLSEMSAAGAQITIIDFHAEATSEKKAMAAHLDGRLGALLGTHTHVQTADAQIMAGGLAYITDVGMTGAHDSVIGMERREVVDNFLTARPFPFSPATQGGRLEGVVIEFDKNRNIALEIKPVVRPPLETTAGDRLNLR
jgi:metallophosphoesterase (TIGR00282 family)